jgi:hypothetical protein
MSPAWARRGGWAIYLYANEPHQVPHVAVRGPGYRANVRIVDGELLAGHLPPQVHREVRELLAAHRTLAVRAFEQTAAHAFPGTLEEMLDRAEKARRASRDPRQASDPNEPDVETLPYNEEVNNDDERS